MLSDFGCSNPHIILYLQFSDNGEASLPNVSMATWVVHCSQFVVLVHHVAVKSLPIALHNYQAIPVGGDSD
jgi:hypothetical protein